MSYQDQLSPWVIYRRLPNLQRQFIDRFRRRNNAEEYLKTVQRLQPQAQFEIVYEVTPDNQPSDLTMQQHEVWNLEQRLINQYRAPDRR